MQCKLQPRKYYPQNVSILLNHEYFVPRKLPAIQYQYTCTCTCMDNKTASLANLWHYTVHNNVPVYITPTGMPNPNNKAIKVPAIIPH